MIAAVKAALASSSALLLLIVGWQGMSVPQHRSVAESLGYCLWVLPLFVILAVLNWIAVLAGRAMSSSPTASDALALVLVVGLTLLVSESTRSLGGAMTRLQVGVTVAFAVANAACLVLLLASRRQRPG